MPQGVRKEGRERKERRKSGPCPEEGKRNDNGVRQELVPPPLRIDKGKRKKRKKRRRERRKGQPV